MRDYTWLLDNFPYTGIFILLVLGGFGLPFPEDIILIITGASIANGAISFWPAILAVFPALLIADFLLYTSGRKYGRSLVEKGRLSRVISRESFEKLESRFKSKGAWYILLGRSVAGLRAQLFLAAGVTGMPLKKFIMVDCLAAVISVSIMVGIGYMGGSSLQVILRDVTRVEHVLIVVAVGLLCLWILIRFYRSRSWRLRQDLYANGKGQH